MKNLILLTIFLALVIGVSSHQTLAQDSCALAQALEFHTAVAVAEFYFSAAGSKTYQNGQILNTELVTAANHLPDACLIELLEAQGSDQCSRSIAAALAKQQDRFNSLAQESQQNMDPQFLTPKFRAVMRLMLESVPRTCWFQPLSQAPQSASQASRPIPCPQEWAAYDSCNEANKKAIVAGVGSLGHLNRNLVSPCLRPSCPQW